MMQPFVLAWSLGLFTLPNGGRSDGLCRTQGGAVPEREWGLSLDQCRTGCLYRTSCTAIEYVVRSSYTTCEYQTAPVTHVLPMEGATCLAKATGDRPGYDRSPWREPINGKDGCCRSNSRVDGCRGGGVLHSPPKASYFTNTQLESLGACKTLCRSNNTCTAIEFNHRTKRCEIHSSPDVTHSAVGTSCTCLILSRSDGFHRRPDLPVANECLPQPPPPPVPLASFVSASTASTYSLPPDQHQPVISRLNARFASGRPSNDVAAAGICVRAFDRQSAVRPRPRSLPTTISRSATMHVDQAHAACPPPLPVCRQWMLPAHLGTACMAR